MWQLPDGRVTTNEVGFELPNEFIPPHTLKFFTQEDLAARGITHYTPPPEPEGPPPKPYVPPIISDRQFFQQLAVLSVITPEEALAAVGPGEIPAAMLAMVAALPEAEQFPARMLLTGATSFDRGHPLVAVFGEAFGWTPDDLDGFWIAASAL